MPMKKIILNTVTWDVMRIKIKPTLTSTSFIVPKQSVHWSINLPLKNTNTLSFSPYTKILIYTKKIDPNTILMKTFWDATSISDALWLKQFIQRVTSPFSFFISNIKKNGGLRVRAKERVKVKTQNMLCNVLLFTMFLVYFNLFIF